MNLDKKSRENWKLAGITLVMAIVTGWAVDDILILGIMLASGLLFGLFFKLILKSNLTACTGIECR